MSVFFFKLWRSLGSLQFEVSGIRACQWPNQTFRFSLLFLTISSSSFSHGSACWGEYDSVCIKYKLPSARYRRARDRSAFHFQLFPSGSVEIGADWTSVRGARFFCVCVCRVRWSALPGCRTPNMFRADRRCRSRRSV